MKQVNPKIEKPTYLFSKDCPGGKLFPAADVEAKLDDGWVDTPARLKLPENGDIETGLTVAAIEEASAEDIVNACKAMGFIVLTPEQLKAEATKMADIAFNAENLTDESVISEFERRFGGKDNAAVVEVETEDEKFVTEDFGKVLLERFNEDPESLNKDDLLLLGNAIYGLSLRSNMKESTMIARITAALNEE